MITLDSLLAQSHDDERIRISDHNGYDFCDNTVAEIKSEPCFIESMKNYLLDYDSQSDSYIPMSLCTIHHFQRASR